MNVALFGQKVLADIIKDFELRSSWIAQIDLISSDSIPYRSQKRRRHIHRGEAKTTRRWRQRLERCRLKESQEPPASERGKERIVSQSLQREDNSADIWTLDFWSAQLEEDKFLLF